MSATDAEIVAAFWQAAIARGAFPIINDTAGDGTQVIVDTSRDGPINLLAGIRAASDLANLPGASLEDPTVILEEYLPAFLEASNWPHRPELQDKARADLQADLDANGFSAETTSAISALLRAFADYTIEQRVAEE